MSYEEKRSKVQQLLEMNVKETKAMPYAVWPLSPQQLSARSGVSSDTIKDIMRNPAERVSEKTLDRILLAFERMDRNDPSILEEEKRWADAARVLKSITPAMAKKAGISYSRIAKLIRYEEWISGHMVANIVKAFPDIRVRLVEGAIQYHDCYGMHGIEISGRNYIENMRGWRPANAPVSPTATSFLPECMKFPNGDTHWLLNGKLHREDGPAIERANGVREWFRNGMRHREDGPAVETNELLQWYYNGELHREDGPAVESRTDNYREWWYRGEIRVRSFEADPKDWPPHVSAVVETGNGDREWHLDGKLHRIGAPAIEYRGGGRQWWVNGKLHRKDGPAVESSIGYRMWCYDGKLHRTDGPAVERANGDLEWWVNGELHREDGPAIELTNGNREWWFHGKRFHQIPGDKSEPGNWPPVKTTATKPKALKRVVVDGKYTYETDLDVYVGCRVTMPSPSWLKDVLGPTWEGVVTSLESEWTGSCKTLCSIVQGLPDNK